MIILAVTIIVLLFGGPVVLYNRLIRARNLVNEGWSGIDVQLKRRHDLVPNLVETVKGYASHEKGVLEDVTRLRAELNGGAPETGENETRLSHSIKTLFAVAESYPELKADKNFRELQKQLAEVEDQLQFARRYYNGAVRNYNIQVESFPGNIIASLFGFKRQDFFQIEYATERSAPDVDFP
jgi:LemA protein